MAEKQKFKIPAKATGSTSPATVDDFTSAADLVRAQTGGRALKPVRVNFDMDPEAHKRLKIRAIERGVSVAVLVRGLIENEMSK